ncbi:MAG: MFS transporter [Elusimicrobiota bacterium]|nr:MFS transporter [Elusimicrobiota bacterium]
MNKGSLSPHNRNKVYLLSAAHLLHDIYTSFLSTLLPLLIEKFTLTYTLAGLMRVMLRIPSLLNPFIGELADKKGMKIFVVISPALTAVAMSLIGGVPHYYGVLALLFVTGISSSLFHVPVPVVLKKLSARRLGFGMSLFQIGGEISRTAGPLIVIGAVSLWGLSGIWRLMPAGVLMSIFLHYRLKNFSFPGSKNGNNKSGEHSLIYTLKRGKSVFAATVGLMFTKSLTASVIVTFLPTYLVSQGRSFASAGATLAVLQAAAVAGVLFAGHMSDHIGRRRLLLILTFFAPVTVLLFLLIGLKFMLPCVFLMGFTAFSSTPVILAMIQEQGFDYPSVANGIYMTMSFLVTSVLVLAFGKLADITSLKEAFYLSAFLSFAGFGIFAIFSEKMQKTIFPLSRE